MDLEKNIRERCRVNTNDEGENFVGVKADTDDAVIYFLKLEPPESLKAVTENGFAL